jgi:hypothetical protein
VIALASVSPTTFTGTVLLTIEPFPNWPFSLSPQHFTLPEAVSAQVWLFPAATATIPISGAAEGELVGLPVRVSVGEGVPEGVGVDVDIWKVFVLLGTGMLP